jgi:hypothetical protein
MEVVLAPPPRVRLSAIASIDGTAYSLAIRPAPGRRPIGYAIYALATATRGEAALAGTAPLAVVGVNSETAPGAIYPIPSGEMGRYVAAAIYASGGESVPSDPVTVP